MTTYPGEVRIKTTLDAAGINAGLTKVSGMLGKLALAVGVGFSINAIVNFSKASVEAASKSETAWSGLGFILNANKRSFTEAKGFLEDYVSDGLVPLTDAIQAYQNMVMTGFDTEQIESIMTVLKDSAAFGRQGQYTMGEAIEKTTQGFRMENSILSDSAGIQKNLAKMYDDFARSIGTTANNLTRAQKNQAIYNGVMAEGGVFAGAAAKYADTYAGKISQLSTAFYNLRVAVGNAIIPILNQIIPILTNVINWFTRLFNIVGQVMNLLYGTNVGMKDTASGAQDAADATGEMADNLENANKAAKGSLAAFDKLNVLAQPAEGGGGAPGEGGGGGGGVIPPIEPPNTDTPWLDKVRDHLVLIQGLVEAVGIGLLAWGISKIFGLDLTKTLGVMAIAAGVVMFVRGAFDALENGVDWDNLILMVGGLTLTFVGFMFVASWTVSAIVLLIGGIAMLVIGILDWIKKGELSTQTFWLLEAAIVAIGVALAMLLGWPALVVAAVIGIALAIYKYWDEIKAFLVGLWESIKEIFGKVATWFNEKVVIPVVNWFKGAWKDISGFFSDLWDDIKGIWNTVSTWFNDNVVSPVVGWFKGAWEDISGFFSNLWDDITEIWTNAGTWFNDHVVTPISDFFKGGFNNIIDFVNGLLGAIEIGINWLIDQVNKFSITNPFTGEVIVGFDYEHISLARIPHLATGAVIPANAPFAAILGDQKSGRNLEAPEALIRKIVREETGRLGNTEGTIHNVIKLDGQVLYEAFKKIDKRVGTSLIAGSGIR
jgi:hypothetical protein